MPIILAISGGPDSTFLLHLLLSLTPQPPIILAHVNYHLRGHDSQLDQKFVENLAKSHQLKLEILSVKAAKLSGNLEVNCRKLRYEFFEKLRQKYLASLILTGHNRSDQTETFLFNLIRGANYRGLSAMTELDQNRFLYRPLLSIPKSEILHFLKTHKIAFRLDKSNLDLKFSRNFLRHKILPLLEKLNPNFQETLSSTIENYQENQQIIDQITNSWLQKNYQNQQFDLQTFLNESRALQRKIIDQLYQQIHQKSLPSKHTREILKVLRQNQANLQKPFGPKTTIKISREGNSKLRKVMIKSNSEK
ncbi:tRNA lysidine(34) synthetase TilS [Candidatus Peregrinibacteria bacterium]|nr:tRNA lysidine(34) synthetase TilS [Candidatus Peregrinibacteria bacterium]